MRTDLIRDNGLFIGGLAAFYGGWDTVPKNEIENTGNEFRHCLQIVAPETVAFSQLLIVQKCWTIWFGGPAVDINTSDFHQWWTC